MTNVKAYRRWQHRIRGRALTRLAQRHRNELRDLLREEREAEPWEPPTTNGET